MLRYALAVLGVFAVLGAACPVQEGGWVEQTPDDAIRLSIREGESATVFDGRLQITFLRQERGGSFSKVTMRLDAGGETTTGTVVAVRQTDQSDVVRLEPFAVRVLDFPGVDSATFAAWEESGS